MNKKYIIAAIICFIIIGFLGWLIVLSDEAQEKKEREMLPTPIGQKVWTYNMNKYQWREYQKTDDEQSKNEIILQVQATEGNGGYTSYNLITGNAQVPKEDVSKGIFDTIKDIFNTIIELPGKIINGIGNFFNDLLTGIKNFLKDLFESDVCRYHDFGSSSKYTQIRCQNLTSVYNALPEYLNFDFGGNLLRIPMINLTNSFTEIGKDYVVINMFFAERDVRNDQWNFGMNFFINFVTLFDYEEKTVTFYSNENIIPSTFLPKESIKSFAIAAIAILFLGCLLLIVIIYDMNK